MDHKRFLIKRILGTGSFGITYLAYDKTLTTDVALKIVPLNRENSEKDAIDEINTLKLLSNSRTECNQYIVYYYDSFIEVIAGEKILFLISEYIDGITLKDYINENIYLNPSMLLSIIYQLISGLVFIHEQKYAHGDIKPDNIIITKTNQVKYIDFGLACTQDCRYIGCRNICSIPKTISTVYTSPDYYRNTFRNLSLAQSNDVWSLGLVIYQLANKGNLPFDFSFDFNTQRNNIILAPKYKSHYGVSSIDSYIDSFLINNCELRPNILTQYGTFIVGIINNGDIIYDTHVVNSTPPSPIITGKYI